MYNVLLCLDFGFKLLDTEELSISLHQFESLFLLPFLFKTIV